MRRREESYVRRRVMEMEMPVRRWMDNIMEDMKEFELKEKDTGDRVKWRERIRCGDPT